MTTNLSDLTKKNPKTKKRGGKRADHEGTIYYVKSRKLWAAAIRLGYDEKGKPLHKVKYAHSQQEALEALAQLKEKYTFAESLEADKMTTEQWIEKWLAVYVTPRVRPYTRRLYCSILRNHAIPHLGSIPLAKLTEIDIQSVIYGPLRNKYPTANLFRILMGALMKKAVKCHLIKYSPAENLELPSRNKKRSFVRPAPEDWKKLLDYKSEALYCWKWIILTEYVTGARLGEILALKWEDINLIKDSSGRLTSGTLHIRHSLSIGMKESNSTPIPLYYGDTKTVQSNRVLPLPLYYCQEIQHYRKVQLEHRLLVPNWKESTFVFTRTDGAPIRPNYFSQYFRRIRLQLGLGSTFHMLRHDMASRMKDSDCFDLKDIQTQLGHSSIKITMDIYTHLDDKAQQEKVGNWLEDGLTNLLTQMPENSVKIN